MLRKIKLNVVLDAVRTSLMDLECIHWEENLTNKPKLRIDRLYKSEFVQEKYLKINQSRTE